MTRQEYEQKREQEWRAFCNRHGIIDRGHVILFSAFFDAFDRAYALGKQEKDAEGRHILTSDAEGEEILTCEKSKAMQLYSHLLDLVENERISEHYSEWCDLEREYIALFGENVSADYFGSKCLPDAREVNFATKKPQPAEPKFKIGDELVWDKSILVKIDEVFADGKYLVFSRNGNRYMVKESDLEPYTETVGTKDDTKGNAKDPTFTDDCKSQCKSPDRLRIAAMAMQAIISRSNEYNPQAKAMTALEYADALIAECEKGGIK